MHTALPQPGSARTAGGQFAVDAPLLHLIPDPNPTQPSVLPHKLDAQIVEWLSGQATPDSCLVPGCLSVDPGVILAELPLPADVDLGFLAAQFKLSGGNIKNIALAAFLAAADGGPVAMTHLHQAIRREYQKMGKLLGEAELIAAHVEWTGRATLEAWLP